LLDQVRNFWERSPLFTGESTAPAGSREYFEEHRRVCIDECFVGKIDPRFLPRNLEAVLDLGCGPGLWTVEFLRALPIERMVSADLTERALELTRARLALYGVNSETQRENAEALSFGDATFTHVHCNGVIHHTPDTERCVREIWRVLKPGGTAMISVYYKNFFLRNWTRLSWLGSLLLRAGATLKGRGRERIYGTKDAAEIVRLYDGAQNPIGKAYSKDEFVAMLKPFRVDEIYYHFFPARSLPFRLPRFIRRRLDSAIPFLIFANVTKL
jgi:ubiquinone/menaquinone biosynthesis C-methylase UbiE